jgi:RNA polymerase sigma factor (sigma-70 family)
MAPMGLDDEALARIDQLTGDQALAALADLPESQREAVRAHILEDLGYDEMAIRLQCSTSVVRQRVSRGLRAIRNRLEEQG